MDPPTSGVRLRHESMVGVRADGVREKDLVHATCERRQGSGLPAGILWVRRVVRPGEGHVSRPDKEAEVVDMAVGVIVTEYTIFQPDDLFHACELFEKVFDFCFVQLRVSILV